jgi:hypothetical protein
MVIFLTGNEIGATLISASTSSGGVSKVANNPNCSGSSHPGRGLRRFVSWI